MAAPIFQETRAKDKNGKADSSTWNSRDICRPAVPYAPAGIPVRMELDMESAVRTEKRFGADSHEAGGQRCGPFVRSGPVEAG